MIIICPSCGKKFELDENLIPDKGRLLKCGSCDQTWFYNKNVELSVKPSTEKNNLKTETKKKDLEIENIKNNEISNYYFNPVIIHLAGIRRRDRISFIKKYKNLFI